MHHMPVHIADIEDEADDEGVSVGPATQQNLVSAAHWAHRAISVALEMCPAPALLHQKDAITYSTHFSGIGTPEMAARMLNAAIAAKLGPDAGMEKLCSKSCCEVDKKCRTHLCATSSGSTHIYDDILDILPPEVKAHVLRLEADPEQWRQRSRVIMDCVLQLRSHCMRCGGHGQAFICVSLCPTMFLVICLVLSTERT